jgi:hypothetical protein
MSSNYVVTYRPGLDYPAASNGSIRKLERITGCYVAAGNQSAFFVSLQRGTGDEILCV